ncbi:MAG: Abi family protein, partial [Gammaproteobacteria bacterium]
RDWSPPVTPRNDRIFYILLMLRYVLKNTNNGDVWVRQCTKLLGPVVQEDKWRVAMGMPENWKEHPVWK